MSASSIAIVQTLLDVWAERFADGDARALGELYVHNPLFWGSTPALARSPVAIERYFTGLPPMEAPRVVFSQLFVEPLAPDSLHAAMIATFFSGQASRSYRLSQTYVRRGGTWRIAAHHASPSA
jgi:hypothetical protein